MPKVPEFVGVAEIASSLGVTTNRAAVIVKQADFPAPAVPRQRGTLWLKADFDRWKAATEERRAKHRSNAPAPQ